jgi:hypothetical protein
MDAVGVERDGKARAWFASLLNAWEHAWSEADAPVRREVDASLCYLLPPVQGELYVSRGTHPPVEASVLMLIRDPSHAHAELSISTCENGSSWTGGATECEWAQGTAAALHYNMLANWTAGQEIPLLSYRDLNLQRLNADVDRAAWIIPGDLTTIDVHRLVEEVFRPRSTVPEPAPREPDPRLSIASLRASREPTGLSRWLEIYMPSLLGALGIAGPSWCGLSLPRKDVLDLELDGDIDIIAGPLEFDVGPGEWQKRLDEESRRMPLAMAHHLVEEQCVVRAAKDGLIRWPPRLDHLAGCEAKVSWFDSDQDAWHATHMGESRRVKGQLKVLLRYGFDRVAFLHLGATKPRTLEAVNPWLLASHDAATAQRTFELLFPPSELPQCGYFQAVVGSIPFRTEDTAGAGGRLVVHQPCSATDGTPQQWRARFLDQLSELPRPKMCRSYVRACAKCGRWTLLSFAGPAPCDSCGEPLYDEEAGTE